MADQFEGLWSQDSPWNPGFTELHYQTDAKISRNRS